ncbi:MAG: prepilin-type N-terminal cleavage/methylation domain-containing protein [Candidatus Omnitrophota bacterium]|nr:prepilin-type N-terminal cleavage/methylation domain-containing protein [Candidatus Omnitrophota bacterium]
MKRGFTLIELIIVIVVIGIIAGAMGYILLGAVDAWTFKAKRNDLLWDARLAINRIGREIREIKNLTSVTTASSSQFRFTNVNDNSITYSLSGASLNRTKDGAANILAQNVSSFSFTYYDSSGASIATPAVSPSATNIRRVRINMTLTNGGQNFYAQSDGVPRNF